MRLLAMSHVERLSQQVIRHRLSAASEIAGPIYAGNQDRQRSEHGRPRRRICQHRNPVICKPEAERGHLWRQRLSLTGARVADIARTLTADWREPWIRRSVGL